MMTTIAFSPAVGVVSAPGPYTATLDLAPAFVPSLSLDALGVAVALAVVASAAIAVLLARIRRVPAFLPTTRSATR